MVGKVRHILGYLAKLPRTKSISFTVPKAEMALKKMAVDGRPYIRVPSSHSSPHYTIGPIQAIRPVVHFPSLPAECKPKEELKAVQELQEAGI